MAFYRRSRFKRSLIPSGGKRKKFLRRKRGYSTAFRTLRTSGTGGMYSKMLRIARKAVTYSAEKKHKDFDFPTAGYDVGDIAPNYYFAEVTQLITQGTGVGQRVGNGINLLKFVSQMSTALYGNTFCHIRIVVVTPKKANVLTTADMPSVYGNVNTDVMTVLYDKHFYMSSEKYAQQECAFSLGPFNVKYSPTTGLADKPIYVCGMSTHNQVLGPRIYGRYKLIFTDV